MQLELAVQVPISPAIFTRRANFCASSLVSTSVASSSVIFLRRQPSLCDLLDQMVLPSTEFSFAMREAAEGVRVNRALSKVSQELLRSKTPSATS